MLTDVFLSPGCFIWVIFCRSLKPQHSGSQPKVQDTLYRSQDQIRVADKLWEVTSEKNSKSL